MNLDQYILDNFHNAMQNNYVQVYYQPVIRTISRKLCSFEGLARWIDPVMGSIRPDQFIPVLEKHELIHILDRYVVKQVCAGIRAAVDAGEVPIPVSINLSRMDFYLCDIFSYVEETVRFYQIPHTFLHIEITESTMARQEDLMRMVVDRFHQAGFQVWMDDFGSAYSSLNILKDFTFDELKLDMRFLSSFDQRSRRILTSVIQMAKEINIHTLAEGVENEEQFRYLRNIGCEKVQGFYFGKPMPYHDALQEMVKKGISIEMPGERQYYDDIGKVDFLSAVPFMSQEEKDKLVTARQLNSIPLAIAEAHDDYFTVLFYNSAFKDTAGMTGMIGNIFSQENLRKPQPYSILPDNVIRLMDSTRSGEEGRMYFISNEEYYDLQVKCIARRKDAYSVLLRIDNLTRDYEGEKTTHLDVGLRQIYTLFERITLVIPDEDRIVPLYVSTREDLLSGRDNLSSLLEEYADNLIVPEDREAYLTFMDINTVQDRLAASGQSHISAYFRTYSRHGSHDWKRFTLLRFDDRSYVELIRQADTEVHAFLEMDRAPEEVYQDISVDTLWKTLIDSEIVRLFWKDADRRFLGASKGFLNYYGFDSSEDIKGFNDEELGWHVSPDSYMNDELQVIHEGKSTKNIPGNCISKGENRNILASKTPIYDQSGKIIGLLGAFIDRELLDINDGRGKENSRRELVTGLLNSRGIAEELAVFEDEYYRRNADFVRIHVSIDDFVYLIRQYGFDFGDKILVALGKALKEEFGVSSSIGRYSGHKFVILHQIQDPEEVKAIRSRIRKIAAGLQEIDGVPVTIYVSIGYTIYSEFEDSQEQMKKTEIRLLADHTEYTPTERLLSQASDLFHVMDDLPVSYSVYRILVDEKTGAVDARIFYVNHKFEELGQLQAINILGQRTREYFPELPEEWYDQAVKAAMSGQSGVSRHYNEKNDSYYILTMSQVIHPGYCAVTYQELSKDMIEGL